MRREQHQQLQGLIEAGNHHVAATLLCIGDPMNDNLCRAV